VFDGRVGTSSQGRFHDPSCLFACVEILPMKEKLRYLTPQLLLAEGCLDLPGPAFWITSFTTGEVSGNPVYPPSQYLHRCSFSAEVTRRRCVGTVSWRAESQAHGNASTQPVRVIVGEACNLRLAREAAVAAALRSHDLRRDAPVIGPAFVLLTHQTHQPRVWGCAGLIEPAVDARRQGNRVRICFIRERLRLAGPQFLCTLEEQLDNENARLLGHWSCSSLPDAAESGCDALLGDGAAHA
jgi:hypothetical protein